MKGFPRNVYELVQLMVCLKHGSGDRVTQDKIHFMLSLRYFTSICYSVLSEANKNEINRQLKELRNVTGLVMCRDKCILQSIEEYYGALCPDLKLTCTKMCPSCRCPSCRGEAVRVVRRAVLIDRPLGG